MIIFFVLTILLLCIFLVHFLIRFKLNVLPESIAVIFLGAIVGLILKILNRNDVLELRVSLISLAVFESNKYEFRLIFFAFKRFIYVAVV